MNKPVAITIGDINGIGIQILLNNWKNNKLKNFIIFTNKFILKNYLKKNNLNILLNIINIDDEKLILNKLRLNIFSYNADTQELNTYLSLKFAYDFCKKGLCKGIINLPLRKDLIKKKINKKFIGQTEFYKKIDNADYVNMILHHNKIIVSPLTTHISIKQVPNFVRNKLYIYKQIVNLNSTLKKDFNISKPKLVISGLNPHSGDNGTIGNEEIKIISPIVSKIRKQKIFLDGPLSADSILLGKNIEYYDCFIFLYHDQALIPFKYISKFSGVNYTGNLSIIRTSPDHGTAYNLVNKKNVSNKSLLNCFKLINKIYKNRYKNEIS